MAITNQNSSLLQVDGAGNVVRHGGAVDGQMKIWTFTQTGEVGDAGSAIRLFTLRANEVLSLHFFWIELSAYGASRVATFGHEAYTTPDGTAVAASAVTGSMSVAVAFETANMSQILNSPAGKTVGPYPVDVVIRAVITGGNIPIGAIMNGVCTVGQP